MRFLVHLPPCTLPLLLVPAARCSTPHNFFCNLGGGQDFMGTKNRRKGGGVPRPPVWRGGVPDTLPCPSFRSRKTLVEVDKESGREVLNRPWSLSFPINYHRVIKAPQASKKCSGGGGGVPLLTLSPGSIRCCWGLNIPNVAKKGPAREVIACYRSRLLAIRAAMDPPPWKLLFLMWGGGGSGVIAGCQSISKY